MFHGVSASHDPEGVNPLLIVVLVGAELPDLAAQDRYQRLRGNTYSTPPKFFFRQIAVGFCNQPAVRGNSFVWF